MTHRQIWWQRPWITTVESLLGHIAAVIVGFIMMVVGLGLGVTVIMLPVGIVIGLIGAAVFVGGLFSHISEQASKSHSA